MSYKNGYGLIRDTGIDIDIVKHVFNDYFDVVEDYYDNYAFVPDEVKGTPLEKQVDDIDAKLGLDAVSNTTLDSFIDEYKNQGIFIVGLVGNPNAKDFKYTSRYGSGHFTCVKCLVGQKQGFIDTWDCGPMLVDCFMRVKKTIPQNDPRHWRYDLENHKFIV